MNLLQQLTVRGKQLCWRHDALSADDPVTAWQGLLKQRGVHESDAFFTAGLAHLPDPMTMQDMPKAVQRLVDAIVQHEHIHIFGDFDCDGVSGTAILVEALSATGATVTSSIPHRANDGHGVAADVVEEVVAQGASLGMSVDTGTTCFEACALAKRLNFDLMITDHHLPDASLPDAFALLNPARADCGFADRQLCGTGVAFFLLMAVWQALDKLGQRPVYDLRGLLDRVAIATVADVMDLVGVNRILVRAGLQRLNAMPVVGLQALMRVARVRGAVNAETIGFYLAPRINAAGRMQHGDVAMRLLLCTELEEAESLAEQLDTCNSERRQVEMQVLKQAESMDLDTAAPAIYHEDWHAGVVGLVAGRLARKYQVPAAVGFVDAEQQIRVSLRGVAGFHIGDLLHACSEHLLGFGGHAGAGGGTVRAGAWDGFVQTMKQAIVMQQQQSMQANRLEVDGVLRVSALHQGLAERVQQFEPVGRGNPAVRWLLEGAHIHTRNDLKGGVMRLTLSDGQCFVPGIVFGGKALRDALQVGQQVSLVGKLALDTWRGHGAIQFEVEDVLE